MRPTRSVDFAIFFILLLTSFVVLVGFVLQQAGVNGSVYETMRVSLRIITTSIFPR